MVVYDLAGVANSTSIATAVIVQIKTLSGDSTGVADTMGQLVRMSIPAGGSAAGSSGVSGQLVRMHRFAGLSVGASQVAPVAIKKHGVLGGTATGAATAQAYVADRDVLVSLRAVLPPLLYGSKAINNIQQAQGIEATRLFAMAEQLLLDYFIDTASKAGIAEHESSLGINPRAGQTLDQRRATIKRMKQRPEILTKQRFTQQIRDDFYACDVEVRPTESLVVSTIKSKRGTPSDLIEFEKFVDQLLPAHMVHEFIFSYLPWGEIEDAGLTWAEAEQYTAKELEEVFLIPFEE